MTTPTPTQHDLTREEAIAWAIANNCNFQAPVFPPPQGWMWADRAVGGVYSIILTPVFTNTEDAEITISDLIKDIT
jgi:hypothetical protein